MIEVFRRVLTELELDFAQPVFERYMRRAAGFELVPDAHTPVGASRLGGNADVPLGFTWPTHRDRPLEFLLQVNLADVAENGGPAYLPRAGTLAFFYDLEEQPWGFDPKERTGSHVAYFEPGTELLPSSVPPSGFALEPARLEFFPMLTLPHVGSLPGEPMWDEIKTTYGWDSREDSDSAWELSVRLSSAYGPLQKGTQHRFGGYPYEVQNPMEPEAQLVSHGIYCGGSDAYESERAKELLKGAGEWHLVLQLDSDGGANLMWGDLGMLYFWSRLTDLAERAFDRSWMTLQCG